ncbi:uncharacterized protein LOC132611888 [Lycium barbarum]|uniref:uncharacterized protein LOC132611888 n=1 Tax=Lycium barbarum TaxID=112863 RepID=UPI00293E05F6|nr:uncharacterized protein LOC132611888 [Lycium barbarum]
MEKFYTRLDPMTQAVANNEAGGCFMEKTYARVSQLLDILTTHNQAWHSGCTDSVAYGTLLISNIVKKNQKTQQTLAQHAINITLLTKRLDEKETKRVNAVEHVQTMPKGMYQVPKGPYQEGPPMQYEYANHQGGSKLESMLEKVLANQEKSEKTLKGLTETVGSHTASIQKLESQMKDILREQYPHQKGGLPIVGAKVAENGPTEEANTQVPFKVPSEIEKVQDEIPNVLEVDPMPDVPKAQDVSSDKEKGKTLVKKIEDAKCQHFYNQLKQLWMNISFLDAFQEMSGFVKVQKKEDPEAFTIPCTIGHHDFARALCDNGTSINLMSLTIYNKLELVMPRPTSMRLQMANRSVKGPVGVVDYVFV